MNCECGTELIKEKTKDGIIYYCKQCNIFYTPNVFSIEKELKEITHLYSYPTIKRHMRRIRRRYGIEYSGMPRERE